MKYLRLVGCIVLGWLLAFAARAAGPLQFYSVAPCRLADTRELPNGPTKGPALASSITRSFPVFGPYARPCGVPTTAKAVALNAAITQPTNYGFLVLWANNAPVPSTSTINFNPNDTIANGALVKLTYPPSELVDPNYQLNTQAYVAGGTVHLILDIVGYYQ